MDVNSFCLRRYLRGDDVVSHVAHRVVITVPPVRCVGLKSSLSSSIAVQHGFPQGSVLGSPNVYIIDLPSVCKTVLLL